MRDEVKFLPADKQYDSIIWGVRSQTYAKYQKRQVYKIFAIPQEKPEGSS